MCMCTLPYTIKTLCPFWVRAAMGDTNYTYNFFALVYYSLATAAFSLLLARESDAITGQIDTAQEYVWLISVIGLGLTMFDAFVTILNHAVSKSGLTVGDDDGNGIDATARMLGSMGVYVAAFMYATRNPANVIFARTQFEEGAMENNGTTSIPYLLAFTVAILGAILSDSGDAKGGGKNENGFYRLGTRSRMHGTMGLYN